MALNPKLRDMVSKSKAKYKGGGGDTVKPKEGRNRYRFIAPTPEQAKWVPEDGQFWADLGVHWIKPTKDGKPIAVIGDSEIVYQEVSPINTAINMAIASAMDEDSKELYNEWKARKSVLINAVNRDANDELVVLELTPTTWGAILELYEMYADEGQDIFDKDEGLDIVITRSGKGLNTKYEVAVAPGNSKPVTDEQMDKTTDLGEFIKTKFFRGEEQKALSAIQQIAGISVPSLGNSKASTPTAALTSGSATVQEESEPEKQAEPEPEPEPVQETAPAADESALSQEDEDAILDELNDLV